MKTSKRALFLDRDGVINVDHGYVHEKEHFEYVDGIFDLCRAAVENGYDLFVITNQAGIGRGYYSESQFNALTDWMLGEFERAGIVIKQVYHSPYHPEHGVGEFRQDSFCRKPNPGMILQAANDHHLDLPASVLIGDKESDLQAGRAAGVGCNILFDPEGELVGEEGNDHHVVTNLVDAVRYLSGRGL